MSDKIVTAAVAAWQGDLKPAEDWLRFVGRNVRISEKGTQVSWTQDGACPGGGICIGHDPNTNLVQLLMGTGGPLLLTDTTLTKPLFKATHDRWTKIRKATEAAALNDEDDANEKQF